MIYNHNVVHVVRKSPFCPANMQIRVELHSPEEVASGPRILCWVMFFHYLSLASLNGLVHRLISKGMTPLQLMLKCRRVWQLLSPGLYVEMTVLSGECSC